MPRTFRSRTYGLPLAGVVALSLGVIAAVPAPAAAQHVRAGGPPSATALPVVTPTPQHMRSQGKALEVPDRVRIVVGTDVDDATLALIRRTLTSAGARHFETLPLGHRSTVPAAQGKGSLTVVVGSVKDRPVSAALRAAGGEVPRDLVAEGYSLATTASGGPRSGGGAVVLAGNDGDGVYYSAQTLRQLVAGKRTLASVTVTDHPDMPLRGSIEGFYGAPWSQADRLDQLAFYGDVKANTYIYAPKDDTYLRDKWRDAYPAAELADLHALITQATTHHVDFTYAISPGLSICYSDPSDIAALEDKLGSLYDQGARSFYVALDDISYTKWNCASDQTKYGSPGQGAAGQAQADLLNSVQHDFVATHAGTKPLQTVPTEYSDMADSPYKKVLREQLDPQVVVQWTGNDVVPPSISVADAQAASKVWGRKVFLWDNYPVNDYGQTTGRLLMAPYDKREAGLDTALSGIVLNPMNQAAASKVALFGGASFAWNDEDYDPARTWRAAADYLADGDARTAQALLDFFDTEHLAPTFGTENWQPQAPALAGQFGAFRKAWSNGDPRARREALANLRAYADRLSDAPQRIRQGVRDQAFLTETAPWLNALGLWTGALEATLDGLGARLHGGSGAPDFAKAADLAGRAAQIRTIAGTTRPQGTVKVADGVLDVFIQQAPSLGD